jgi:GT2 family glycosyltransferase
MQSAQPLSLHFVTWNSARYLPNLFLSLDAQTTRAFTVTVVDNASADGTMEWLTEHRPDVATLRNTQNKGFSRGHNQAISLAFSRWEGADFAARYVLVANPDLEFAPDAIEKLIAFMDEHPDVDACCPKLLRAIMQEDTHEGGIRDVERTDVIDAMGIGITKSRRMIDRGAGERDTGQYDLETRVFGPSGACALYRASSLQAAAEASGWFDESFFAYQEDVDLAWRMRRMGCDVRVVPAAAVWHHRQAKGKERQTWANAWMERFRRPALINFLSTRNHGWVVIKNDEIVNLLIHAPWWVPYECAKVLASLLSWTQIRAQIASFAKFPAMFKKRAAFRARVKVGAAGIRGWFA